MQMDVRVTELLSSKICHDLISPVSAINNGVELIEDIGDSVVGEAMKLIADSASLASRRLRLFRIAYGRAGSEENLPVRDVRLVAEQYFTSSKTNLDWKESLSFPGFAGRSGGLKVLMNLLIMGEELLPYGGSIVLVAGGENDPCAFRLEIAGRSAGLAEPYALALSGSTLVADLTPRTIQSYVTGRFAACFGFQITWRMIKEEVLEIEVIAPEIEEKKPEEDIGMSADEAAKT